MRGYTGEMEYSVWNDLIGGVGKFQKLAEALDCKTKMNQIVCEVLGPTGAHFLPYKFDTWLRVKLQIT